MSKEQISRRGFLKGAGLSALAASGLGAGLLSGCAPRANDAGANANSDGLAETGQATSVGLSLIHI